MRTLYRLFRKIKRFLIQNKVPVITTAFFSILPYAERLLSARWTIRANPDQTNKARASYFSKYSRENPPFVLQTRFPLAVDSNDHLCPHGTLHDNSLNKAFNLKLYDFLGNKTNMKLLDLGCSGGAFVKSILEDGYTAVGLEGSDLSKKQQSGEWGVIPLHLFTCDITKPFALVSSRGEPVLFDVVTAWEVLEHLPRPSLPTLIRNIHDNLSGQGFFIASVAVFPDANPLLNAVYHVTLEPREWWVDLFVSNGFREVNAHGFNTGDWVRGNGKGLINWDPADGDGFHMVLQKQG